MRALNEASEAQQAGDTIVPDRAAFCRETCQLEYEYQEPAAETASGWARTPPSISPGGGHITWQGDPTTPMEYYNGKDLYRTYRLLN